MHSLQNPCMGLASSPLQPVREDDVMGHHQSDGGEYIVAMASASSGDFEMFNPELSRRLLRTVLDQWQAGKHGGGPSGLESVLTVARRQIESSNDATAWLTAFVANGPEMTAFWLGPHQVVVLADSEVAGRSAPHAQVIDLSGSTTTRQFTRGIGVSYGLPPFERAEFRLTSHSSVIVASDALWRLSDDSLIGAAVRGHAALDDICGSAVERGALWAAMALTPPPAKLRGNPTRGPDPG